MTGNSSDTLSIARGGVAHRCRPALRRSAPALALLTFGLALATPAAHADTTALDGGEFVVNSVPLSEPSAEDVTGPIAAAAASGLGAESLPLSEIGSQLNALGAADFTGFITGVADNEVFLEIGAVVADLLGGLFNSM